MKRKRLTYPGSSPGPDDQYERFAMQLGGSLELEHMHRYLQATRWCADRQAVLDIACGEGYGAFLLAQVAESVVGVDISPRAIRHAAEKYPRENLTFRQGGATAIPLEDDSVDAVVSFETIEHLDAEQQEPFLREIRRVLRPGGIAIISSPNREAQAHFSDENPFHKHELAAEEFESLIARHFPRHRMLHQNLLVGSYLQSPEGGPRRFFELDEAGDVGEAALLDDLCYQLCVAGDGELPDVSGDSFYLDTYHDAGRKGHFPRPGGYVECLRASLEGELDAQNRRAERLQRDAGELNDRLRQSLDQQADLEEAHARLKQRCRSLERELGEIHASRAWRVLRVATGVARRRRLARWRKLIEAREQFDAAYYLAENPDVAADPASAGDPLGHYLRHGGYDGRDPRAGFDTAYYLQTNPDVAASGAHPLVHYVTRGFAEGRAPCAEPDWYDEWVRMQRSVGAIAGLRRRWRRFRDFWRIHRSRLFDAEYYLHNHPDVLEALSTSRWWRYRSSVNPLLRRAARYFTHPIHHYLLHGVREGRSPSSSFDPAYYLSAHADVRTSGVEPFAHYCRSGQAEGREAYELAGGRFRTLHVTRDEDYCPTVSVIVPNYNHAAYLPQRLDSIYHQTYRNMEVILLDDASSDASRAVLDDYAGRYADITHRVYNDANSGGVFRQWAKGLSLASGELVWIAESDDYCDEDFLATLAGCFRDEAVLLAYARYLFVGADGTPRADAFERYLGAIDPHRWRSPYVETAHNEVASALGVFNTIPNASGAVFRRPVDMPLLGDEDWLTMRVAGDWMFYLHLIAGGKIAYCPETTSCFRFHDANTARDAHADERFYREVGAVARRLATLYDVPTETLERNRDFWKRMYDEHVPGGTDEGFEALFGYRGVLDARAERKPTIMVSTIGFSPGGAEILPIRFANEYRRRGHPVVLHSADALPFERPVREMVRNDVPVLRTFETSAIRQAIREFGIDVLNSHHLDIQRCVLRDPGVFGELPLHVATLHGMMENPVFEVTDEQLCRLDEAIDVWVYTADKNTGAFARAGLLDDSPRFVKLPNGMEPPTVEAIPRETLGVPEEAFVLCCVARAIPEKGWAEGIEAVGKARRISRRDIRLVLVGNGPVYDDLLADGVPDYVVLVGFHENSVGHYAASDLGFMPTRFGSESFPLTVVDCLFAGNPYLATAIGEIPNMLAVDDGQAGATFPLRDGAIPIDQVAELIARFADDEAFYAEAASRAGRAAARYRIDAVTDRYLELFAGAGRQKAPRAAHGSATRVSAPSLKDQARDIRQAGAFDEAFYRAHYPDVASHGDPLMHYLTRGGREGRLPNDWFDGDYVAQRCPAIQRAEVNPLWYYCRYLAGISGLETHSPMRRKGICPVCQGERLFLARIDTRDSYNHLRCVACGSAPRDRALRLLLDRTRPDWRDGAVHESSPSNGCLRDHVRTYSASQFYPDRPLGTTVEGFRNENLETMTFEDGTFDVIVAVDVVEHVFHPERMLREMLRVVRPGGLAVFTTVPDNSLAQSRPRSLLDERTGDVRHLHPPVYHGNPVGDGALMTWEFGRDFDEKIRAWTGCALVHHSEPDEDHGIIPGGVPHVYLLTKPADWTPPEIDAVDEARVDLQATAPPGEPSPARRGQDAGPADARREAGTDEPISFYQTDYYKRFDVPEPFSKTREGYCPVCQQATTFSADHRWLRDRYLCRRCGSTPRQRHLQHVLEATVQDLADASVHECAPINDFVRSAAGRYSASQYLPELPAGEAVGEYVNEDLHRLTFADDAFDVFVAQDVLEHLWEPDRALREMLRVTAPGGAVVLTVPLFAGRPTVRRARRDPAGRVEHLRRPVCHGDPVNASGSLAVWDFGDDFEDLLRSWLPCCRIEIHREPLPEIGVEGEMIDVIVLSKPDAVEASGASREATSRRSTPANRPRPA